MVKEIFYWRTRILPAFLLVCLGAFGVTGVLASSDSDSDSDQQFRWLMGMSDPDVTGVPLCEMGMCPDKANEAGGGMIEMEGVGTLTIDEDGDPEGIKGGGKYTLFDSGGNVTSTGTFKAKRLIMFDNYGGSNAGPPPNFRAGRMLAEMKFKPSGGGKILGVVELGCRIPGNPGIPGTIEGIRVYLDEGPGFIMAVDPRSTLFVDLN